MLQVVGATNYTHWEDAHAVRACVGSGGSGRAQQQLQEAAIARLETFAHVGLMEDLDGSILSLAASVGLKLDSPAWKVASPPSYMAASACWGQGVYLCAHGLMKIQTAFVCRLQQRWA